MLLPKFQYHDPTDLEEACQIMDELKGKAKLLAGGTDLIVNMKKGIISPENLVSLGRVKALNQEVSSNGQVKIGACTRVSELARSDYMGGAFSAVRSAAGSLGSHLIRNLATVGGNIVSARPAADLPPPLMAYGARVILKNLSGERSVPLEDFFTGPGDTVIEPGEILTEILLDKPPDLSGAGYFKLGVRKTLEISLVNVAAFISLDGKEGSINSARVVLGSVAPTPIRAITAEKVLVGERPSESLFSRAGEAAAADSKPIDDFRGSAAYRRDMVEVLTRRTLNMALKEAREG